MDENTLNRVIEVLERYWRKQDLKDQRLDRACPQLDELLRAALPSTVTRHLSRLSGPKRALVQDTLCEIWARDVAVQALVRLIAGFNIVAELPHKGSVQVSTQGNHVEIVFRRQFEQEARIIRFDIATIRLQRGTSTAYALDFTAHVDDDRFSIQATPQQLAGVVLDLPRLLSLVHDSDSYGRYLRDQIFSDERILGAFRESFSVAQNARRPLQICIDISPDAAELHGIHWEKLWHPTQGGPLSTRDDIWFSRVTASDIRQASTPVDHANVHILVAVSSPSDLRSYGLPSIDAEAEFDRVKAIFSTQPDVSITFIPQVTQTELIDQMRSHPTILYLVCHGKTLDNQLWLFLENVDGTSAHVLADALATEIKGLIQRPYLAILAACESAGTGIHATDPQFSVQRTFGIQLVESGVPAVIAMQGPISIQTMQIFGPRLLKELSSVRVIDRAVAIARSQVRSQPDWWAPCLYLRR